ncbi:hypothetical protein G6L37_03370 [Agrobacterium rubi]|nr:hypothetical protein [Agrobacterium rubi]NTF24411.1 hypothetical protein [Agrobacterium rubi]
MLDENLLITASKAARGITAAQAAVDEAKRLVEEAKLGVETAKSGLSEAKAAYDAVISEIAGAGVSASKARKAVEDMLRIFADIGIIDGSGDEAPVEPKAPRRKKAESAQPSAEVVEKFNALAAQGEPGVINIDETAGAEVDDAVADAVGVTLLETVQVEGVVYPLQEEADVQTDPANVETVEAVEPPPVEVASEAATATAVEEAPVADVVSDIDNQEALREIFDLIESSTDGQDLFVSETLISMLNAAEWYSREHRGEPLSLNLYGEILNGDFAAEALATPGIPEEVKGGLEAVVEDERSDAVFAWFFYALGKLEEGKDFVGYGEFHSSTKASEAEQAAAPVEIEEEEIFANAGDFIADPEADEPEVDVSDDETLAVDQVLVGEEVANIEEINFLEPTADVKAEEVVAPSAPAAEPAAEAPAPRRFTRPNFVPKK